MNAAAKISHEQHSGTDRSIRWVTGAAIFCIVFGLMMLLQTQPAGDGIWFWHAEFLRQGRRLYADLHLALQPLFVLETATWIGIAGKGWLIGKVPAALHLIAYVTAFALLVRQTSFNDRQRAAVLLCCFFASIAFEAYRFDDYHVVADCFQLYSILALLRINKERSDRALFLLSVALGIMSGLAITCRLNDGLALALGVFISLLWLARRRVLSALLFCATAAIAVISVVALTGDTLRNYATYSIFKAAGNKGGAGSVLAYPLKLPVYAATWVWSYRTDGVLLYLVLSALVWGMLLAPLARPHAKREKLLAIAGMLILVIFLRHTLSLLVDPRVLFDVSGVMVLLTCAFVLWTALRGLIPALHAERFGFWDRRQILYLIPLGQLASGSMSSGGSHLGLYMPIVVLVLVLLIAPPFRIRQPWLRDSIVAVFAVLFVSTFVMRAAVPFSWITYREHPLFVGRTIYRHPLYGPMIIDRDLLQMIQPVCANISADPSGHELLSMPLPYANYFCGIPPWNGYVQTFFDTTSAATIDRLMQQLEASPPAWIFYQRQLKTMSLHEKMYTGGRPLEHRKLDDLIEQKIANGEWRVVYASDLGNSPHWDNKWLLLRTH